MVARLILISFFIGLYISYFLSFISAVFIQTAGIKNLPFAYILAGLGGTLYTKFFQKFEVKYGFFHATLFFLFQISSFAIFLWVFFHQNNLHNSLIFASYIWFWISGNFLLLIFWKLPTKIFDLNTNKRLNSLISTGEVISALIGYISVPILLSAQWIKSPHFLLLLAATSVVFVLIVFTTIKINPEIEPASKLSSSPEFSFFDLLKKPFFFAILSVMLVSFAVRFIADYLALHATSILFRDTKQMASFLALMFGSAKLFEFLIKTTVTGRLFKTYGISAGLILISVILLFTTGIGLVGILLGAITFSFIIAIINKILERSLTSAIYTPAHNILYHAFPIHLKSTAQNFSDGYGKTYGQFLAGLLIFFISLIPNSILETIALFLAQIILLGLWYKIGLKLISLYKNGLSERILGVTASPTNKKSGSKKYYDTLKNIFRKYSIIYDSIQDLKSSKYSPIVIYLESEIEKLTTEIFGILSEKYGENTIRNIEIQLSTEKVISFELLELLLNDQEKHHILPVLKYSDPGEDRDKTQFNERIRLFSLAHDPYNPNSLRKLALESYAKFFGNQDQLISALTFCPDKEIQDFATNLLNSHTQFSKS